MIILFFFFIPLIPILIKLILYLIVRKYGKFSYDGFSAGGFAYNSQKDIFYSTKNAWQKNFGYTRYYDLLAPLFRMIIDTEPVKFYYNNQNWLITFWKGQYGIVTGAEIGVYYTNQQRITKKTIYLPVSSTDMLNMSIILSKNGKIITRAKAKHWWLAIFKLGMFSNPKDLAMDITINFPNQQMLAAFLASFTKLGYTHTDFKIIDNTICFKYTTPRTKKVWTRTNLTDTIRQFFNQQNVNLYNDYLADLIETNKLDDSKNKPQKLIILNELIPQPLKNNSETQVISNKIFNPTEQNIILMEPNLYSENRGNNYE